MHIPRFEEKEMEVRTSFKDFFGQEIRFYSYPVSGKEAVRALLEKRPYWMMNGMYMSMFGPKVNPDNVARGQTFEAEQVPESDFGGKDMFGIEWEYVPQVGGSMVRPGSPLVEDAAELEEKLVWPDPDSWDWEGSARTNAAFLKPENCNVLCFLNGWFERLISFMDFENALMALYDEEQKDAVHAFFTRLTDLYIRIFDKYIQYYPQVDGFMIHDDWGSQKETFFSPGLAEEMIVPHMRRLTDFLHAKGKFCELHSCGKNEKQVPNFIKAGWDIWQGQPMNDTEKLFDAYGDQIVLGVFPAPFDTAAEESVQQEAARAFVKRYMVPGKACILNYNDRAPWTTPFMEELYRFSRQYAAELYG